MTLALDLARPGVASHERSLAVYALAVAIAAAMLGLTPRVGSRVVSAGAGLAAGGALATAVTGLAWPDGVPNPLVWADMAFNVADVAIGAGVALLIGGSLFVAWTERANLGAQL